MPATRESLESKLRKQKRRAVRRREKRWTSQRSRHGKKPGRQRTKLDYLNDMRERAMIEQARREMTFGDSD